MTATDIDLDTLLDALAARARSRSASTPLVNEAGDAVTPYASTGRITVNPGDIIASVWGNTTFDQTVQAYDTTAARDSQWPTPKDGAVAYTADTGTIWLRRAGVWKATPLGYVTSGAGPASQTDYSPGLVAVVTLSVPVVLGRRYRINATLVGNQQTTTGNVYSRLADDQGQIVYLFNLTGLAANGAGAGSTAMLYTPTSTKTATITLYVNTSAGTFRIPANNAAAFAEDIGF